MPFYPFSFWVPLLKPNSRKKGTLIIKGFQGSFKGKGSCTGFLKESTRVLPGFSRVPVRALKGLRVP